MNISALTVLDWELIQTGPLSPAMHMALDQVLTDEVSLGRRRPTLRIWEWSGPTVVLGRYQSLSNEVDAEAAAEHHIGVVRRISGGGAMFVEPGNTITYSLYLPVSAVAELDFRQSYELLDSWVITALNDLGIQAHYQPLNDIASPQGKIAGAAQARRGKAVLHHVTMAYDIDADKMLKVLRIGREKISDKGIESAGKRVDPLRSQTGLSREEVIASMVATFGRLFRLMDGRLTQSELYQAQTIAADKFASEQWTGTVP